MENKEKFMKEALKEARKAYDKEEVPVGAVIVKDNKIIARAHNLKETNLNAVSHAEILAIQKACKKLGAWRLTDCDMYVTLEPCSMCAGALINARIRKLYIGTNDPKTGACGSKLNLLEDIKFNHSIEIERDVMQKECEGILKDFFKFLRERNKNEKRENI
jgi:tRNA(adenine34) deaminase